jgi:hypothetical protein
MFDKKLLEEFFGQRPLVPLLLLHRPFIFFWLFFSCSLPCLPGWPASPCTCNGFWLHNHTSVFLKENNSFSLLWIKLHALIRLGVSPPNCWKSFLFLSVQIYCMHAFVLPQPEEFTCHPTPTPWPRANPTWVTHNASVVNIYNTTSSPARLEIKNIFFYF